MLTLTNVRGTDGTMKNGQFAETGNIRHTRHVTEKNHNITQKTKEMGKTDNNKNQG